MSINLNLKDVKKENQMLKINSKMATLGVCKMVQGFQLEGAIK